MAEGILTVKLVVGDLLIFFMELFYLVLRIGHNISCVARGCILFILIYDYNKKKYFNTKKSKRSLATNGLNYLQLNSTTITLKVIDWDIIKILY